MATLNNNNVSAQFESYYLTFDYFNAKLFGGELPHCLLNFSRSRGRGFFAPNRWASIEADAQTQEQAPIHEISLNPEQFKAEGRTPKAVASTLVHEMAHLWQQVFGKPSNGGYHNKEWGRKMKEIGLFPSSTAQPGGKETGTSVSHYIIEGGAFEIAWEEMPENMWLPYDCIEGKYLSAKAKARANAKKKSKTKYTCPCCGSNAWAKPDSRLACGNDHDFVEMEEQE